MSCIVLRNFKTLSALSGLDGQSLHGQLGTYSTSKGNLFHKLEKKVFFQIFWKIKFFSRFSGMKFSFQFLKQISLWSVCLINLEFNRGKKPNQSGMKTFLLKKIIFSLRICKVFRLWGITFSQNFFPMTQTSFWPLMNSLVFKNVLPESKLVFSKF